MKLSVKLKSITGALALSAAVWLSPAASEAGLLIDAGPSSGVANFSGGDYVAGTEFTTGATLTIRSLGWLDVEGDGLGTFTHTVGLWDVATEALLASADVTSSSSTVTSAQGTAIWYLENIAPLEIVPGTYRVAGLVGPDDHSALSNDKIGNGVTLSNGYVRTEFPNGGFAYPDLTFGNNAIRATLSTDSVEGNGTPDIPAPGMLGLFGIGLAGLGLARRRKAI